MLTLQTICIIDDQFNFFFLNDQPEIKVKLKEHTCNFAKKKLRKWVQAPWSNKAREIQSRENHKGKQS